MKPRCGSRFCVREQETPLMGDFGSSVSLLLRPRKDSHTEVARQRGFSFIAPRPLKRRVLHASRSYGQRESWKDGICCTPAPRVEKTDRAAGRARTPNGQLWITSLFHGRNDTRLQSSCQRKSLASNGRGVLRFPPPPPAIVNNRKLLFDLKFSGLTTSAVKSARLSEGVEPVG
jgi:hypothetical protein